MHYIVHHHRPLQIVTYMEITEVEWWQINSSLVHSSLKVLILKVIRRIDSILSNYCCYLAWLDHC